MKWNIDQAAYSMQRFFQKREPLAAILILGLTMALAGSVPAEAAGNPINGLCGAASGQTLSSPPTTLLCSTGTPSAISGSGPWTWSCTDNRAGAVASCSAAALQSVSPPPSGGSGYAFPNTGTGLSSVPMQAVATFNSIGLYWKAKTGSAAREGLMRFRQTGTATWRQANSLWYDDRALPSVPAHSHEYRGSIVELKPNTSYDIEAFVSGVGELARTTVRTWTEKFPIAKTVTVSPVTGTTYTITESGTPSGYILYTAPPGTVLDAANMADCNIYLNASYVIVRGLTLKNAAHHGIYVDQDNHDVVIENNDISNWGAIADDGWGVDSESAIWIGDGNGVGFKRFVIQRNRLHNPRGNSNNWTQARPSYGGDTHPYGPIAIFLYNTEGNHVIRFNEIFGDASHYFNDGIGGADNFSFVGSPSFNSDINGNKISNVWDDCIEAEGANMNVRIWGNYFDRCYVMIAHSSTSLGPVYDFRNVFYHNEKAPGDPKGTLFKLQSPKYNETSGGRVYIYHNTAYNLGQTPPNLGITGSGEALMNTITRNNIFSAETVIDEGDRTMDALNDFDQDLYLGIVNDYSRHESHGIKAAPIYDPGNASGRYTLSPSSPGYDNGARIPNFNDSFYGSGPDRGAQERGAPPLKFGVQ